MYDILVVGGGPAGMTAALYGLRNGKKVLVIEKTGFGGQITHSPKVENYPGTLQMSGNEFADQMLDQILAQGAEIELECVTGIETIHPAPAEAAADSSDTASAMDNPPFSAADNNNTFFSVRTMEGGTYEARSVILAPGVRHRMLGLDGEEALVGEGISFCAVCDGDFYSGQTVCVAGGGNSALQEALLLSEKCEKVIILQDLPYCTGEQRLQEVLSSRKNVQILTGVTIQELLASEGTLTGLRISRKAAQNDTDTVIPCSGLFVAIGLIPENEPFASLAALNHFGYFDSDEQCLTKTPGLFVAGDCRSKSVRQLTTAAADGAVAALAACRYLDIR